jgi:hypothetical protein
MRHDGLCTPQAGVDLGARHSQGTAPGDPPGSPAAKAARKRGVARRDAEVQTVDRRGFRA